MQNQEEIWRDVKNYEGIYKISNLGNVKSNATSKVKLLKNSLRKSGYYGVCLNKDGKSNVRLTHHLIAESFLNHTICNKQKLVVDHIDNNKKNNRLDNLQIITFRYNLIKDKTSNKCGKLGVSYIKGSCKFRARINIKGYQIYIGSFNTIEEASNAYNKELNKLNKLNKQ